MKIVQISTNSMANGGIVVIGLGEDNKPYAWDSTKQDWILMQS